MFHILNPLLTCSPSHFSHRAPQQHNAPFVYLTNASYTDDDAYADYTPRQSQPREYMSRPSNYHRYRRMQQHRPQQHSEHGRALKQRYRDYGHPYHTQQRCSSASSSNNGSSDDSENEYSDCYRGTEDPDSDFQWSYFLTPQGLVVRRPSQKTTSYTCKSDVHNVCHGSNTRKSITQDKVHHNLGPSSNSPNTSNSDRDFNRYSTRNGNQYYSDNKNASSSSDDDQDDDTSTSSSSHYESDSGDNDGDDTTMHESQPNYNIHRDVERRVPFVSQRFKAAEVIQRAWHCHQSTKLDRMLLQSLRAVKQLETELEETLDTYDYNHRDSHSTAASETSDSSETPDSSDDSVPNGSRSKLKLNRKQMLFVQDWLTKSLIRTDAIDSRCDNRVRAAKKRFVLRVMGILDDLDSTIAALA